MNKVELLPCPFCDGEAEIYALIDEGSLYDDCFVKCPNCGCCTRTFKTARSAILMWNNRKPIKRIVERLWKEKEECKEYNGCKLMYVNISRSNGIDKAIEIVREEGGLND